MSGKVFKTCVPVMLACLFLGLTLAGCQENDTTSSGEDTCIEPSWLAGSWLLVRWVQEGEEYPPNVYFFDPTAEYAYKVFQTNCNLQYMERLGGETVYYENGTFSTNQDTLIMTIDSYMGNPASIPTVETGTIRLLEGDTLYFDRYLTEIGEERMEYRDEFWYVKAE